jgi:hypothetical protein
MIDIPQEVWANVAEYLRQPLPPAGEKSVTWRDLHQQDLATMMRVSNFDEGIQVMLVVVMLSYKTVLPS